MIFDAFVQPETSRGIQLIEILLNQENCIDNTLLFICIHLEFFKSKAATSTAVCQRAALHQPDHHSLPAWQKSECGHGRLGHQSSGAVDLC